MELLNPVFLSGVWNYKQGKAARETISHGETEFACESQKGAFDAGKTNFAKEAVSKTQRKALSQGRRFEFQQKVECIEEMKKIKYFVSKKLKKKLYIPRSQGKSKA